MQRYESEVDISAPIDHVWQILTQDMPRAPEGFGILRLEGQIARGARIKLWSEVAPKRAFSLAVDTCDPPTRMVWRGGMPFGLFTGRRTFTLTPNGDGCHFHMREVFTGPMSGLITRSMPDLTPSFTKFAQALKTKAQAQ